MQTAPPSEAQGTPVAPDPSSEPPAFAEELPPDFWDEPPPPTNQAAPQGVRAHPLFAELQSLFPGRIVEEHVSQPARKQEGDASDATEPGDAEAVDLELPDDERDT